MAFASREIVVRMYSSLISLGSCRKYYVSNGYPVLPGAVWVFLSLFLYLFLFSVSAGSSKLYILDGQG